MKNLFFQNFQTYKIFKIFKFYFFFKFSNFDSDMAQFGSGSNWSQSVSQGLDFSINHCGIHGTYLLKLKNLIPDLVVITGYGIETKHQI